MSRQVEGKLAELSSSYFGDPRHWKLCSGVLFGVVCC